MRGEHNYSQMWNWCSKGSSPHARGTQLLRPPGVYGYWDHPRMRGEHWPRMLKSMCPPGSSPHARGTPDNSEACYSRVGIIPACAGNTESDCNGTCMGGDHPRMRGEHSHYLASPLAVMGSSPHARGTLADQRKDSLTQGIIPACAGNTLRNPNNPNPNISLSIDFDSVYIICYQKLIQRL